MLVLHWWGLPVHGLWLHLRLSRLLLVGHDRLLVGVAYGLGLDGGGDLGHGRWSLATGCRVRIDFCVELTK